ncbi:MAG TPA: hypothetical protein VGM05_20405 [Planctomycetaceae bacterium]|jgi:hypothetical protein
MNRKLRIFALFAILSLLAPGRGARGDESEEREETVNAEIIQLIESAEQSDEPSDATSKPGEKPLEELVPKPDSLMPHFDPEGAEGATFDNGTTPARWLDRNDQFLNEADPYPPGQDPFRERPGIAVGWFAGVDINVVQPSIHSQAINTSLGPGDPFTGTFTNSTLLPTGEMNWTVMPKIQLGYRRENGLGEFVASYRYVESDGSGTILHFDTAGAGSFNSRTQAHVLDLVYGFSDRTDDLPWFLPTIRRYSVGLRVASWIFDTTANGAQTLEERAGNVFIGGGPVLSYDWLWFTAVPGLTFDGGFDAAGVGGFNYQRFAETAIVGGGINSARGRTDGSGTATPILGVWGGWAWAPNWGNGTLKFSAGYRWERWWNLPDAGGQNELTLQGPYLRGEFRW